METSVGTFRTYVFVSRESGLGEPRGQSHSGTFSRDIYFLRTNWTGRPALEEGEMTLSRRPVVSEPGRRVRMTGAGDPWLPVVLFSHSGSDQIPTVTLPRVSGPVRLLSIRSFVNKFTNVPFSRVLW